MVRKMRKVYRTYRPLKRVKHHNSKKNGSLFSGIGGIVQIDSMLYGAVREKISNVISPYTSKIPLGGISDEIGMALIDYLAAKKGSGMIRDIGLKGLVIENARVGDAIVSGVGLSLNGTTKTEQYVYG